MPNLLLRRALTIVAIVSCPPASADIVYESSSGIEPDDSSLTVPYTYGGGPIDPFLNPSGALEISTNNSSNAHKASFYQQSNLDTPGLDTNRPYFLEATLRIPDGGTNESGVLEPASFSFSFGPGIDTTSTGTAVLIGNGSVKLLEGDNDVTAPTAVTNLDGQFHTYRLEYDGINLAKLFFDGTDTGLSVSPFSTNLSFDTSTTSRITWGDTTSTVVGTSEWTRFAHGPTAIPEPNAVLMLATICLLPATLQFTRRRHRTITCTEDRGRAYEN